jgi:hypothetical protein
MTPASVTTFRLPYKFGNIPRCNPGDPVRQGPTLWLPVGADNVEVMKASLRAYNWPIIVGFNVTQSFDEMWFNGGGWSNNNKPRVRRGHAVVLSGMMTT